MRYFFRTSYDGSVYGGWQRQNNADTVQQRLEEALATLLRYPCAVVGAGRTDAGVHARRQGVHFDAKIRLDVTAIEKSMNAILPRDISIFDLQPVSAEFNARFCANSRMYKYYLSTEKEPLAYRQRWQVFFPSVDWALVASEAQTLHGTHDFQAFCASGSSAKHARCAVKRVGLEREGTRLVFTIEADRFVYRMVRSLIGTLVARGRGVLSHTMAEIIESRDRRLAGPTAPAWALVLEDVTYPEQWFSYEFN